jgi:hypothetical protein
VKYENAPSEGIGDYTADDGELLELMREPLKEADISALFTISQPHAARNCVFDNALMHEPTLS